MSGHSFFKLVLLTNATGLDRETVKAGLKYFNRQDEIWCKLDGGSVEHLQKVNRPEVPPEHVFSNILALARQRPVVIQSLFPAVNGTGPHWHDVEAYVARLKQLLADGAKISLVQIYSATRTAHHDECGHVPLRTLSKIAAHVRKCTGLRTEVF
jgi:wyosine [tRNA(Phe)-imidazoG37] synthetase (radical SAM superfamily)